MKRALVAVLLSFGLAVSACADATVKQTTNIRFYKAAVDKGWIFTDPRAAKSQPGQAKAMAEMYKKIADIGGMAYETDMQIKLSGGSPMGALLGKIGNMSYSTVVDSVDTGSLPDTLFAPPADYKLNPKK